MYNTRPKSHRDLKQIKMASMASGQNHSARTQPAEDILLECSSGVALAINTNRTGLILVNELAGFFTQVNRAYCVPNPEVRGAASAKEVLEQVGVGVASCSAAQIKRLVVKLGVDISSFLVKKHYVDAVVEMTGTDKVIKSDMFATWLRVKFSEYPDKLQRIQDIAIDFLLAQQQKQKKEGHGHEQAQAHKKNQAQENHTSVGNAKNNNNFSGIPKVTAGRMDAASSMFDYSFVSPKNQDASAGFGSSDASSSSNSSNSSSSSSSSRSSSDMLSIQHSRRKTMIALDVFSKIDRGAKSEVSRRDFLLACRKDPKVAKFLGLPQKIRQEGSTRDSLEHIFQGIGSGDTVTVDQFVAYFRRNSIPNAF